MHHGWKRMLPLQAGKPPCSFQTGTPPCSFQTGTPPCSFQTGTPPCSFNRRNSIQPHRRANPSSIQSTWLGRPGQNASPTFAWRIRNVPILGCFSTIEFEALMAAPMEVPKEMSRWFPTEIPAKIPTDLSNRVSKRGPTKVIREDPLEILPAARPMTSFMPAPISVLTNRPKIEPTRAPKIEPAWTSKIEPAWAPKGEPVTLTTNQIKTRYRLWCLVECSIF